MFDFSYEVNSVSEDVKNDYSRTFIDMNEATISHLRSRYSLGEGSKIYILIKENNDSNLATADYTYEYILENGTKLNLDDLEENLYIDVYVPIKDLDAANFELAKKYAKDGYDIYNLYGKFYTDFCVPVSLDGNDVSLEDRKKEIYPNNITLCKSNCIYKGVDLENQRVICNCNINNKTNDEVEVQDNENFVAYTIDYINYKLFLCYKLFFNAYYIRHSYAFFIILLIFVITLIFDFTFLNYTLENLKKYLIKQMPSYNKFYKDIFKEEKQCEENIDNMNIIINDGIIANPLKKELKKNKNKLNKSKTKNKRHNSERVYYSNAINGKLEEDPVKTEEPFKEEIKIGKKEKRLEKRRRKY